MQKQQQPQIISRAKQESEEAKKSEHEQIRFVHQFHSFIVDFQMNDLFSDHILSTLT